MTTKNTNNAKNSEKLTSTIKTDSVMNTSNNNSRVQKADSGIPRRVKRTSRISLAEQRRMVDVPKDPDYVGRWVNDTGDRINKFLKAGYEVLDRDGNEIERDDRIQDPRSDERALTQDVGQGVKAYFMRIPREWYEEDQKKKQNSIDGDERSLIRRAKTDPSFYGDGIKIDHANKTNKNEVVDEVIRTLQDKNII